MIRKLDASIRFDCGWNTVVCFTDECNSACEIVNRMKNNNYEKDLGATYDIVLAVLKDYENQNKLFDPNSAPDNSDIPNKIASDLNLDSNLVYFILYELYYSAKEGYASSIKVLNPKLKQPSPVDTFTTTIKYLPYVAGGLILLYIINLLPKVKHEQK